MAKFCFLLLLCCLLATTCNAIEYQSCDAKNAEIVIATFINGADLIAQGFPSPVGTKFMKGPRLAYLQDRTYVPKDNTCSYNDLRTGFISPNTMEKLIYRNVGGKFLGVPTYVFSAINRYFRVFNESDVGTDCILKASADWKENTARTAIYAEISMKPEDPELCQNAVPNLKIADTGLWYKKVDGRIAAGNTFMVYFDTAASNSTSQAASAGSGFDDGAEGVSSSNKTAPYLPKASSPSSSPASDAPLAPVSAAASNKAVSFFSASVVLLFSGAAFNFV